MAKHYFWHESGHHRYQVLEWVSGPLRGELFDPQSMYARGGNTKFVNVSKKTYDNYLNYCSTRNGQYLREARRSRVDGEA